LIALTYTFKYLTALDKDMGYKIDWAALLELAEEVIKKGEEIPTGDENLTEIDKVRGVEHAYYEMLEQTEKILQEAEAELGNSKVTPTEPIQVSKFEKPLWRRTLGHKGEHDDE
jgi:NADH dehydrogenase/NADH:ubiquinone oxidoreductase subunit G